MFYVVSDTYGTRRFTWTLREALDWLRYCSPQARIHTVIRGRFIAARTLETS